MKKRFLSMFLAITLCLGLAVPAFAASENNSVPHRFVLSTPEGFISESQVIEVNLRYASVEKVPNQQSQYVVTRDTEITKGTIKIWGTLLLDGFLTINGLRRDGSLIDVVFILAYSDPDYDGIYDQQIFLFGDNGPTVPLTEKGPIKFVPSNKLDYEVMAYIPKSNNLSNIPGGVLVTKDSSVQLDASYLDRTFGPNTLLQVMVATMDPGKPGTDAIVDACVAWYYLPGEQKDYQVSAWAKNAVNAAAAAGIIPVSVETAHNYDLRGTITRGEFAAIIVELYEALYHTKVSTPTQNPFPDVSRNDPNYEYILKASKLKIVNGMADTGKFAPNQPITRSQMAAMIYRLVTGDVNDFNAQRYASSGSRFSDVGPNSWYSGYVGYCADKQYVNGVGNNEFQPNKVATVEQALKIAVEILNAMK